MTQDPSIAAPRKEPVSPALIHKALLRVRGIARGNGIDANAILLDSFNGEMLHFNAETIFTIKPAVVQKTLPGREKGEVCASAADMHASINEAAANAAMDDSIGEMLVKALEQRADKGFMADVAGVKLEHLSRTFLHYGTCNACTGGKINCMTCHGAGMVNCFRCKGRRTIPCVQCRGAKVIKQASGSMGPCRQCNGHGDMPCPTCRTVGRIKCKACTGSGRSPCVKCAATGVVSEMAYVGFEAGGHFHYDRSTLPPEAVTLIHQTGNDLIARNHAVITLQRRHQNHGDKAGTIIIPCSVALPWGVLTVRVGADKVEGTVFGQNPRLVNMPAFVEKPLAAGVEHLARAAHTGDSEALQSALRYRIIADAVTGAAELPPKKAAALLHKHWPFGVRGETLDDIANLAARAYSKASLRSRWLGLGIGLLLATAIDAAYLIGPLRTMAGSMGIPSAAMMGVDALIVAITGALAVAASKIMAKRSLRNLFEAVIPAERLSKLSPRSASMAPYAYGGALVVFLVMMMLGMIMGNGLPPWAAAFVMPH